MIPGCERGKGNHTYTGISAKLIMRGKRLM